MSEERPGELADVDEALRLLVAQSPLKHQLLKAGPVGGGKVPTGSHGNAAGEKPWQAMTVAERAAYVERHGADRAAAKLEADQRG